MNNNISRYISQLLYTNQTHADILYLYITDQLKTALRVCHVRSHPLTEWITRNSKWIIMLVEFSCVSEGKHHNTCNSCQHLKPQPIHMHTWVAYSFQWLYVAMQRYRAGDDWLFSKLCKLLDVSHSGGGKIIKCQSLCNSL